jgi:hypothetical protein
MLDAPDLAGGPARILAEQTFAALTARDGAGRLWISPLTGAPGFLQVRRHTDLQVHAAPAPGIPCTICCRRSPSACSRSSSRADDASGSTGPSATPTATDSRCAWTRRTATARSTSSGASSSPWVPLPLVELHEPVRSDTPCTYPRRSGPAVERRRPGSRRRSVAGRVRAAIHRPGRAAADDPRLAPAPRPGCRSSPRHRTPPSRPSPGRSATRTRSPSRSPSRACAATPHDNTATADPSAKSDLAEGVTTSQTRSTLRTRRGICEDARTGGLVTMPAASSARSARSRSCRSARRRARCSRSGSRPSSGRPGAA